MVARRGGGGGMRQGVVRVAHNGAGDESLSSMGHVTPVTPALCVSLLAATCKGGLSSTGWVRGCWSRLGGSGRGGVEARTYWCVATLHALNVMDGVDGWRGRSATAEFELGRKHTQGETWSVHAQTLCI